MGIDPALVARARPLNVVRTHHECGSPSEVIAFRKERWQRILGGEAQLTLRLRADGIDEPDFASMLRSTADAPSTQPAWSTLAASAGERARHLRVFEERIPGSDAQAPLPFEHLVAPFVLLAVDRAGSWSSDLLPLEPFARAVLRRLTQNVARTAIEALREHPQPSTEGADAKYRDFVATTHHQAFGTFFDAYPVLARLLATITLDVTDAFIEIGERLLRDRVVLAEHFGATGAVIDMEMSLGDTHENGRAVACLRFANGVRVAYKPRSVAIDGCLLPLLAAMQEARIPAPRVPRVVDRGPYGWVEWVTQEPARDAQELEEFYASAGSALAIFYALGTVDAHFENVIASRNAIVPIDLETLLSVQVIGPAAVHPGARAEAMRLIDDSVLNSALLWSFEVTNGIAREWSGLGVGVQKTRVGFEQVNTDEMREMRAAAEHLPSSHRAVLQGEVVDGLQHQAAIERGFVAAYDWLLERKSTLLQGLLAGMQAHSVRVLLRHTRIYRALSIAARDADLMAFGVDRSLAFEHLARGLIDRPALWPALRLEQMALERDDVPRFWAQADETTLRTNMGSVVGALHTSAIERARVKLAHLSIEDRERQLGFIRTSMLAAGATVRHMRRPSDESASGAQADALDAFQHTIRSDASIESAGSASELLYDAAYALAARYVREAIRGRDGSAHWIGLTRDHTTGCYAVNAMTLSLFDGSAGVAVFLAAMARASGESRFRDTALDALAEFIGPEADHAALQRDLGHGAVCGVGSVLYALTLVSRLLDDRSLLIPAEALARTVTSDSIAQDREHDVISGSAGTLLGLLSVYRETGSPYARERAVEIGHHLLARRIRTPHGMAWTTTIFDVPITGFSHGASGIAFALLRLAELDLSDALRDAMSTAALEAFAFERRTFDATTGAWRDLRPDRRAAPVAWCHGAAGMGLARLPAAHRSADVMGDVESAIALVQRARDTGYDSLCCGLAGRVELLMEAADVLERPDLHNEARKRLLAAAERSQREGSFRLLAGSPTDALVPGLYQGAAGVGYQLLRARAPHEMPSILSFA